MLESHAYHPNRLKLTQLFLAGAVAGVIMTVLAYLPLFFGFPPIDFGGLYGALFYDRQIPPYFSGPWFAGLLIHLASTTLPLPLIYDYLIERRILPNVPTIKGWLFGALIWFFVEAIVRPLMGEGLFARSMPAPLLQILLDLVCWVAYGSVLESMLRVPMVHRLRVAERRAA